MDSWGIGKGHEKWSPAATVTFIYEPDIYINENIMETLTLDEKREWIESCPTKVFYINPDTQQVFVYDAEAYSSDDEVIKKVEAIGEPGFVALIPKMIVLYSLLKLQEHSKLPNCFLMLLMCLNINSKQLDCHQKLKKMMHNLLI